MGTTFPQLLDGGALAETPAVPRRRKAARVTIDPPEFHAHEADRPVAALRFRQPHTFAPDGFADEDPVPLPLDLPLFFHAAHLVRGVILRFRDAGRVGSG